jgi:hypothetical protein
MMLGSGDPTPLDGYALLALCLLAITLLVGCILGPRWVSPAATVIRYGAMLVTALIVAGVLILTPTTSGIVSAGRIVTLWPAAIAASVLFLAWSWRLGNF